MKFENILESTGNLRWKKHEEGGGRGRGELRFLSKFEFAPTLTRENKKKSGIWDLREIERHLHFEQFENGDGQRK
mgnify:CR=1 FL=1